MASTNLEIRQALSQSGRKLRPVLGHLYDARCEEVLLSSILKTTTPPPESIISIDGPGLTYKHTTTDSLEEKLSSLDISAELGVSVLCGMLGGGWCIEYLSRKKTNTLVRQASTICVTSTKTETLKLENDALKSCLNLDALHTEDATHVICGIEWGARTLVTVKEATRDTDTRREVKSNLENKPSNPCKDPVKETSPLNESLLSRLTKFIGEMHVRGKGELDSKLSSIATVLDFEIAADVANIAEGGIPANFEEVKDFLRNIPSSLKGVNGGKGVPIAFYLLPIKEVARTFKIEIQHDTIVRRLKQDSLDDAAFFLEKLKATTRDLGDYIALVEQHSYCVPTDHIEAAQVKMKSATRSERVFKQSLMHTIIDIRRGKDEMESLLDLLQDYSSVPLGGGDPRSILGEYADKISFADTVKFAGAEYISHNMLDTAISSNRTGDVYILYFNSPAQRRSSWNEDRQTLIDLLNGQANQYHVLIVDYDVPKPKDLEVSYIEQRRGGKVIIPNVTQNRKDLAELCQLKCDIETKADRTRSVTPPPGRRVVRIPCPGKNCFMTGKLKWICPTCLDPVCYGFTDDYLYCLCSRYLSTDAVFKCNRAVHGTKFVKYGDEDLRRRLKALDPSEEYNILILGKSGVGKSIFINALVNYLEFQSLDEAMADTGQLRYVIPFSFAYQDERKKDHEVVVGKESIWEKFSMTGKSSTKKSLTYCFNMDGKTVRFIDTPGIIDTEGPGHDHRNVKEFLRMLESVGKLSAILILLTPNDSRLDATFRFCMTELLSRLHRDTSQNILFGFTNANTTSFTLGATRIPLDKMLTDLTTGIVRGESNQYFFDSEGFMFLAAYKQNLQEMPGGKSHHATLWTQSAGEVHRLVTTVMGLPTHDVSMTLKLNRTRSFLEGMAKTLANFTTSTKTSQKSLENSERELAKIIARGGNLAEKAKTKITITVPVRYNLPRKQTVCCHPSCVSQVEDENGVLRTVFKTVCHDNCNITVPDEIKGDSGLQYCSPFRRWLKLLTGYECERENCKHDWREHMHISYELRNEERTIDIDNEAVIDNIRSNEDVMQMLKRQIQTTQKHQEMIRKERAQIQTARALFYVYLSQNSVGRSSAYSDATVRDATVQYLDLHIAVANQDGRTEDATELTRQKSSHTEEIKTLKNAIAAGTVSCPDEEAVDREIEGLKNMTLLGKDLMDAIDQRNVEFEGCPFIQVESKSKTKKGPWFRWL